MEENKDMAIDIVEQKFDPARLDNIKRILEISRQGGKPQTFEIEVDGLRVIQRTPVVEMFDSYKSFVNPSTRKILVTVYRGTRTPSCTQHLFLVQLEKENLGETAAPTPKADHGMISKAEAGEMFSTMIEKERMNTQIVNLLKENEALNKRVSDLSQQVAEAEEYMGKQKRLIFKLRTEQGEKGSELFQQIVDLAKNPPDWVKLVILRSKNENDKALSGTEKEQEKTDDSSLSENDKRHISVLRKMEEALEENELHAIMIITDKLIEEPKLIPQVADQLDLEIPSEEE
jgi:hypothetical protein